MQLTPTCSTHVETKIHPRFNRSTFAKRLTCLFPSQVSPHPYISISLASVFQHECDGEEDGSNVVTAAAHNSIIKSSKKRVIEGEGKRKRGDRRSGSSGEEKMLARRFSPWKWRVGKETEERTDTRMTSAKFAGILTPFPLSSFRAYTWNQIYAT